MVALYCSLYYLTGNHRRRQFSVQYRFLGFERYYWDRVINGITYSKWMTLVWQCKQNFWHFIVSRFRLMLKRDASEGCVLAMLTLSFAVVIGYPNRAGVAGTFFWYYDGEMRGQEGACAILWPDNGMLFPLFPLFSRDYWW